MEEQKEIKRRKKTEGVVLMAFGKQGYYYAAFNMALSIKHFNKDLKISLIHDGDADSLMHLGFFDKVIKIDKKDLYDKVLSPALAKISIYKYLPYDHNLYLDVDGMALQDVAPLLDKCKRINKPYITEVRGVGGKKDTINYSIWATNEDIWNFFELTSKSKYPAIQSSFAYIQKTSKAEEIFEKALEFYKKGFPLDKLTMQWGGTLPDELIFSGACASLKYNPSFGDYPIFFGWKHTELTLSEITEQYYIVSLYGNGKGNTLTKRQYIEWYDRLLKGYSRAMNLPPHYKSVYIMRDKHANQR